MEGEGRSAPRGVIARWTSLNGKAVTMQLEFKWLEGLTSSEFSFWSGPTFWFAVEGEWIDGASFDHPSVEREMTFGVRALRDIARARQREAAEKSARERQRRLNAERETLDEL